MGKKIHIIISIVIEKKLFKFNGYDKILQKRIRRIFSKPDEIYLFKKLQ